MRHYQTRSGIAASVLVMNALKQKEDQRNTHQMEENPMAAANRGVSQATTYASVLTVPAVERLGVLYTGASPSQGGYSEYNAPNGADTIVYAIPLDDGPGNSPAPLGGRGGGGGGGSGNYEQAVTSYSSI